MNFILGKAHFFGCYVSCREGIFISLNPIFQWVQCVLHAKDPDVKLPWIHRVKCELPRRVGRLAGDLPVKASYIGRGLPIPRPWMERRETMNMCVEYESWWNKCSTPPFKHRKSDATCFFVNLPDRLWNRSSSRRLRSFQGGNGWNWGASL